MSDDNEHTEHQPSLVYSIIKIATVIITGGALFVLMIAVMFLGTLLQMIGGSVFWLRDRLEQPGIWKLGASRRAHNDNNDRLTP